MKATRWSRLTEYSSGGVGLHFLESVGNLCSRLFFSWAGGGEQQVELSAADKTYISDVDALVVVRRGGLPRS